MKARLRVKDVEGAVLAGVTAVGGAVSQPAPVGDSPWAGVAMVGGVLTFLAGCHLYERHKRARFAAARRQLTALEAATAAARAETYDATSCPVCLEDFGDVLPKELLVCGHAFCPPCLSRSMAVKLACPICRQPVDSPLLAAPRVGPHAPPPQAPPHSGVAQPLIAAIDHQPGAAGIGTFLPELHFRMRSLQRLHPRLVPWALVERWSALPPDGSFSLVDDFAREVRIASRSPVGRGGGGGGGGGGNVFGGGSSHGGGGRGAGW